jgi:hypothetical protein
MISGNPQAVVSGGSGSVTGVNISGNTVTVNLTGVLNAQTTSVTLNNVSYGVGTGNVTVSMGALLGDTNGDRLVNSGDSIQTRNRSGSLTDGATFRSDVNLDGVINSGDSTIVRRNSGTGLAPEPAK